MKAEALFSTNAIGLSAHGSRRAVMPRWWTTRYGVLLCEAGDEPLDAAPCAQVTGDDSLLSGATWDVRSNPSSPHAAALEHARLPRAVRWATALRALAAQSNVELTDVDIDVGSLADSEGPLDACRAAALLGWREVVSSTALAELILRWRDRRPWTELRGDAGGETRILVLGEGRLPAKARFGRHVVEAQMPAKGADSVRIEVGGEALAFQLDGIEEFSGSREFEVLWTADGRVFLDFLVDERWKPMPLLEASPWTDLRNVLAASVYRELSYWSSVLDHLQCKIIEPLAT